MNSAMDNGAVGETFLSQFWDHKGVIESLHLSRATSIDWRSFCCEFIDRLLRFADQEAIGWLEFRLK